MTDERSPWQTHRFAPAHGRLAGPRITPGAHLETLATQAVNLRHHFGDTPRYVVLGTGVHLRALRLARTSADAP